QEPAGDRTPLSRQRDRRADRAGLGIRRRRRAAQHVAAHRAARALVHRRKPGAVPDLLALSRAAAQGVGAGATTLIFSPFIPAQAGIQSYNYWRELCPGPPLSRG